MLLSHGETSRFFPFPVATAEVRVSHRVVACALYSIHNSCRVTPGFLISVSKYSMSGITSSDAGVSLGGKMSFSSVSWDISAGNGHDREEALKRTRTSKTVEALMYNAVRYNGLSASGQI